MNQVLIASHQYFEYVLKNNYTFIIVLVILNDPKWMNIPRLVTIALNALSIISSSLHFILILIKPISTGI